MNEFQADAIFEEERERRAGVTAWTELPTEHNPTCLNCDRPAIKVEQGLWCSENCRHEFVKCFFC
jgi:hypothetical protein